MPEKNNLKDEAEISDLDDLNQFDGEIIEETDSE